jgi:hypothetical protein
VKAAPSRVAEARFETAFERLSGHAGVTQPGGGGIAELGALTADNDGGTVGEFICPRPDRHAVGGSNSGSDAPRPRWRLSQ